MKKVFYLISFFVAFNTLALPRVTSSKLSFSQNENLLSRGAKDCVERPENSQLSTFLKSLDDINCNSKKDPDNFCKCVKMISNNGLNISQEREEATKEVFKSAVFSHIQDSIIKKILSYENFKQLDGALRSTNYASSCLSSSKNTPILERLLHPNGGEDFSAQEKMKKNVLLSLRERLKVNDVTRTDNDLLSTFGDQVVLNSRSGYSSIVKFQGKSLNKNKTISFLRPDWGRFEDGAFLSLLKVQKDRDSYVEEIRNVDKQYQSEIIQADFPTLSMSPSFTSFVTDKSLLVNTTKSSSLYTRYEEIGRRLLDNECRAFNNHIETVLEDTDMDTILKGLKSKFIHPVSDGDYNLLNNVSSLFEKQLDSDKFKNMSEEKKNEIRFDLDRVYCKIRGVESKQTTNEDFVKTEDELVQEFTSINHNLDLAKAKLRENRLELSNIDSTLESLKSRKVSLEAEQKIRDGLNSGAFTYTKDGEKYLNPKDPRLLKQLQDCKQYACEVIAKLIGKYSHKSSVPHEEFLDKLSLLIKSQSSMNISLVQVEINDLKQQREQVAVNLKESEKEVEYYQDLQNTFTNKIVLVYGHAAMDRVIARSSSELLSKSKVKNHVSSFISSMETNSDSFREDSRKSRDFVISAMKSASTVKNEDESYIARSPAEVKETENKAIVEDSSGFSIGDLEVEVNKQNPTVNSSFANIPTSTVETQNTSTIEEVSESSFDERDQRIVELEKSLAALNNIIDESNSKTKKSESTSDEELKKISDLKVEIEKQKLLNEKRSIENQVKELKKQRSLSQNTTIPTKSTNRVVASPVVSGFTSTKTSPSKNISDQGLSSKVNNASVSSASTSSASGPSQIAEARSGSSSSNGSSSESTSSSKSRFIASDDEGFLLSTVSDEDLNSDSRVVIMDFNINTLKADERNELIKGLFIEGEESILIELPSGEKLLVENTELGSLDGENKELKKSMNKDKLQNKEKERRNRMKYQDLKQLLKVGAAEEEF